jgi:hypothetical protein
MQTLGLQTVLQMSSTVERVQQVAQQHGAVSSEQFKNIINKQNDEKKNEVQGIMQAAVDVQIKEDMRHPNQQHEKKEEPEGKALAAAEAKPEGEATSGGGVSEHGGRLDIKI